MSDADGCADGVRQCVVCGTSERPEKGWIFRSKDVRPDQIADGELKWEAKQGAEPICSTDCMSEHKEGSK